METIIFPASAGRAGKAIQNDSRRKTVRNSLRSGRNRWKHLCALRTRPASSEKRRSRPTFSGSGMENVMPRSLSDVTSSGSVPNRLRTHSCRSVRTDGTTLEMMTPRKSDGERFLSSKSCLIADSYWLADQVWLMSIRAVNSREYACCGAIRTPSNWFA